MFGNFPSWEWVDLSELRTLTAHTFDSTFVASFAVSINPGPTLSSCPSQRELYMR